MAVLHDETRARWTGYAPDKFIRVVINGAMHDKIALAYTTTHVYTQVVHRLPATTSVWLPARRNGDTGECVRLRDLFIDMRNSITRMSDIIQDATETLPVDYTYISYIQQVMSALREHAAQLLFWAEAIRNDEKADLKELRHMNGKSVQQMAEDITTHTRDIISLLNFATEYAQKFTRSA